MALGDAIEGARHTAQLITWQDEDGTAWTLTSSTITGTIRPERGGVARAITGTLVLVDSGNAGQFNWTYSAADIATPGVFWVQFKATFTSTYDLSKKAKFEVLPDIS